MNQGLVTIFGGAGFIGKYVVRKFVKQGWRVRVAMRRPHTGLDLKVIGNVGQVQLCLLYTSPSPRDLSTSRMPSSA